MNGPRKASAPRFLDETRRRVQQENLRRCGPKDDLLYRIRGLLRPGREHLSDRQVTKLEACLRAGGPAWDVTIAWHAHQQLRSMYQASDPAQGRRIAERVIAAFPDCPGPRGRPAWPGPGPQAVEGPTCSPGFDTHRISNGGTEAVNLIIEKTRRLAHGSGRSSTTGYGSCSQPQEPAPTGSSRQCLVPKSRPKGLMLHVSGYGPVRRSKLVHG